MVRHNYYIETITLTTIAFTIPFPIKVNVIVTATSSLVYLGYLIATKNFDKIFFKTSVFTLIFAHILILAAGLLYTQNIKQGYAELERYILPLLFPVLLYQIKAPEVIVPKLLIAFTLGCLSITLFGFLYPFLFFDESTRNNIFQLGHAHYTDNILIHPTYLSIYLTFAFFFLVEKLRTGWYQLTSIKKAAVITGLLYVVGTLLFLRSQMGVIISVILSVVYILVIYKKRAWFLAFLLFTVGFLVFLLDTQRIKTVFDSYGKNVSTALDQRFLVWQGTIEGIKTAPIFGAGTGDSQSLINEGYVKTGYKEGIDNAYNAHNQYLQFITRNGLLELLCFLALFFYSFKKSLKMPNYTFLMFNMAITLIMFAESFLQVHKGIVFFYFFISLFICSSTNSKASP